MYRAIDKIQNNSGATVGYLLQGDDWSQLQMQSADIKNKIISRRISVYNLDITADGKLIHIPRYDKLGLTVTPEVFFYGKLRDWELQPNQDGSTFLARNLSTGDIVTFQYCISENGQNYMITAYTPETGSLGWENISRTKRETIDQFKLDEALTKLARDNPGAVKGRQRGLDSAGVKVIDCGTNEELDLTSASRNLKLTIMSLKAQPYTFVGFNKQTGMAGISTTGARYKQNIPPDELKQLIRSRLVEIHSLALSPSNEFIQNKNVMTGPINAERLSRLKAQATEEDRLNTARIRAEVNKGEAARKAEQKPKRRSLLGGVLDMMDSFSEPSSTSQHKPDSSLSGLLRQEKIDSSKPLVDQLHDAVTYNNPDLGMRAFNRSVRNNSNKDKNRR